MAMTYPPYVHKQEGSATDWAYKSAAGRREQLAAETDLREYLERYEGMAVAEYFTYALSKFVKLDETGLEIKKAGGFIIDVHWGNGETKQSAQLLTNNVSKPLSERATTYYGAWADKLRWLGHATYDYSLTESFLQPAEPLAEVIPIRQDIEQEQPDVQPEFLPHSA